MSKQDQEAGAGAIAIQSGGNTTINQHHGLTVAEVRAIMGDIAAAQLMALKAEAREVADERCQKFITALLHHMKHEKDPKFQAFRDPDFQILLGQAQQTFARSGDDDVLSTLTTLIDERSKVQTRSRLALSLNAAVEVSSVLTAHEFAELSLSFLLRHTRNYSVNNIPTFIIYFKEHISPLLPHVQKERFSYDYMVAQGCIQIDMGEIRVEGIFHQTYGGIFSKGFDKGELLAHIPPEHHGLIEPHIAAGRQIVIQCINDPEKLMLNAIQSDDFLKVAKEIGLSENERVSIWNLNQSTFMRMDEIKTRLEPHLPDFAKLVDCWDNGTLKHLSLTSVGTAVGFANMRRVANFNADLNIWIK